MTVKTLKHYCRMFSLKVCANKSVLQSQLEEFSKDQGQWDRLRPGVHQPHKGSHTVTKAGKKKMSCPKLSAQHLAKLCGDRESNAVHDGRNPVEHSKDLCTPQEISEILPWAHAIIAKHPCRPESEVTISESAPARPGGGGTFLPQWQTESTISSIMSEIAQKVSAGIIARLDITHTAKTSNIDSDSESLTAPSSDSESVAHTVDKSETCCLKLGDGTEVSFVLDDVPDPVAITFNQDIPRLNAMWDDTSPHWGKESVLMIEGRPIPIVYWPYVYHYSKYGQWQGTKSQWTGWRDIVTQYHQSTPEDFWKEFSVNSHATYRKGDEVHVMRNKSAIARHYQQLKKLQ
ncbi:hypothetical protein BDR07DRAFT_1489869 [Suillus spraguei]|nr:hypothetical protein BDR07DRAFT_1489869 [Suillus spraguei]